MITRFLVRPHIWPRIRLFIEDEALAGPLCAYFEGFCSEDEPAETETVSILGDGPPYRFLFRSRSLQTEQPIALLADVLHDSLLIEEGWTGLHAAGVAARDKAYLFAAATTTGKTTLTAYLLHEGFSYLSDDCLLISQRNLSLSPTANTLHLRRGGRDILCEWNALPPHLRLVAEPGMERFVYTPPVDTRRRYPIGGIYLIARSETNQCRSLSQTEAMPLLMKNAMVPERLSSDRLRFWMSLAAQPVYWLAYRDLSYVAACIREAALYG